MSAFDNQYQNRLYADRAARQTGAGHNFVPEIGFSGANKIDFEAQNAIITKWGAKVRRELRSSARRFSHGKPVPFVVRGKQREGKLAASIQTKIRKDYGAIDRLTFNFERHGVFVHKGVGRGYRASGSLITRIAPGETHKPRVPVEWFNPVLDLYLPELVNKLADLNANIAVNATLMYIK